MSILQKSNSLLLVLFLFVTINSFSQPEARIVSNPDTKEECFSPYNLEVEIDTVGYDQYQLNFSWQMSEPEPGWVHWDDGVNYTATVAGSDDLYAAARWDPFQLSNFDGFKISKIRAFLYEPGYDDLEFYISNDPNFGNAIYSGEHDTLTSGDWVVHEIDTAVYINESQEYWIGYKIIVATVGRFYLGCDNGPVRAGYGDKISTDGGLHWDNLSDFGFDYNFNIQFYVEDTSGNEVPVSKMQSPTDEQNVNLSGYNLYQSIDDGDFELVEFIPYEFGDTTHSILFDAQPKLSCYQLRAVWTSPLDTCISAGAISKENPEERFVCVLLTDVDELDANAESPVKCYPNPFTSSTTFEFELKRSSDIQIQIFNHLGEKVEVIMQKFSAGKKQLTWSPNELPVGMYYFTFQSGSTISTGKLVLMR